MSGIPQVLVQISRCLIILISYRNRDKYDQGLAAFLSDLPPHSLESFYATGYNNYGPQVFQALSCHGESLVELKLNILSPIVIPKGFLPKYCTNLVWLSLRATPLSIMAMAGSPVKDGDESQEDALLEIVAWLNECQHLRTLNLYHFPRAAALMASIFSENRIHLTSLECEGAGFPDTAEFLSALANQTSLQSLHLKEAANRRWSPEAVDVLAESMTKLVNLTVLRVSKLSICLSERQTVRLARCLPKLEVWTMNGDSPTDQIWGSVASLRSLRILYFGSQTDFTAEGVLGFIEKLGPGNKGLYLILRGGFSSQAVREIEKKIAQTVGGRFVFA